MSVVYGVVTFWCPRGMDGRRFGLIAGGARERQRRLERGRRPGCHGRVGQSRAMRQALETVRQEQARLTGELMRRSCQGVYCPTTGTQKVRTTCLRLASLCYDGAPRKTPRHPADWDTSPRSKESLATSHKMRVDSPARPPKPTVADWTGRCQYQLDAAHAPQHWGAHPPSFGERTP